MTTQQEEKTVYGFFLGSVLLKGAISLAEILAGVAVLFLPPATMHALADTAVTLAASLHAPAFIFSRVSDAFTEFTTGTALFISVYLLSRGLVKVFLIWAMLLRKLWAYPASLVILALFLLYQLYQIVTTHSIIVIGISLFDIVVMYFIWREYRILTEHQPRPQLADPVQ